MADPPKFVLSYAPPPPPWSQYLTALRRFWWVPCVLLVAGALVYFYEQGPTSVEIRLDSGDVRYCWYGIPLKYERMREPQRSRLLALAAREPAIPAKWVTCFEGRPGPEANPIIPGKYWGIAAWAGEDPNIARWLLDEVTDYLQSFKADGSPAHLAWVSMVDMPSCKVHADWRNDEEVRYFCSLHGYTPPAKSPSFTAKE